MLKSFLHKRFCIAIVFCLFGKIQLRALGNSQLDSLIKIVQTSKTDTIKVNNLHEICWLYLISGDYKNAENSATTALRLSVNLNFKMGIAKSLNRLSNISTATAEYNKAINYANAALKIMQELNYKKGIAAVNGSIGNIYTQQNNYPMALNYYLKCAQIMHELNDSQGMAESYSNISIILKNLGDYHKAIEYCNSALEIKMKLKDSLGISVSLSNLASVYQEKGDNLKALSTFKKSLKIAHLINDKFGEASSFLNIGISYIYLKNYTEALRPLDSSLTISKSIAAKDIIANCNNTIADVYNKIGNYKKALQFADSAIVYSRQTQSLRMESTSELTLSEIYENMNEGTLALIHYKKSIDLRDKIMDTKKVREMTKSIIQNEYEQKIKLQKAIQLQKDYKVKLDSQKKKNLIIALLSISIILLLVSALIFLFFTKKSILVHQQKLMLEQKILRTQMNPHFIYNSLAMIHSFILRNKTKEASDYLIKFSKLLRNVLNSSRTDFVSLNTEIKMLTNYLELQKLVLEKGFDFNIVIDENIHADDIQIPSMLAQPFIENALKHGIAKHSQNGIITISFKMLNKALIFEIMDNGIGYTTSIESKTNKIPEYESLAITITQERLNNTSRKNKIAISITDIVNAQGEISGTKASFEIPFKSSFNNF